MHRDAKGVEWHVVDRDKKYDHSNNTTVSFDLFSRILFTKIAYNNFLVTRLTSFRYLKYHFLYHINER